MSDTKLKTETIDGRKVEIWVTEGGSFKAYLDGSTEDSYAASTLSALTKLVREVVKGRTKEVPAAFVDWRSEDRWSSLGKKKLVVQLVIISGIHAGNKNVLYRHEGQTKSATQQGSRYGGNNYLRRPTEAEQAELAELHRMNDELEAAIEAWHERLRLDVPASLAKGEPVLKGEG